MKTTRNTRNSLIVAFLIALSALMSACDNPTCDPKCGCATDGQATGWAYCMATK